jgi:polyphosphate kinase 2 (PPK2 family)
VFETAELGASISKSNFKKRAELLRKELLDLQMELREVGEFPVIIVFGGVDGAGKGSTTNILNEWMDTRWLNTHAYGEASEVERDRPEYWRYWRDLPPKGQIGIYLSSWYSQPILDHVYGKIKDGEFASALDRIATFESTLAEDGAVVLKFWMHLSKPAQKRRLKNLESDPLTKWQVTKRDWKHWDMYKQFVNTAERTILRTNTGAAPWQIVDGEDYAYRSLMVGETVRDAIRNQLEVARVKREVKQQMVASQRDGSAEPKAVESTTDQVAPSEEAVELVTSEQPTVLSALDMSKKLAKREYRQRLGELQARVGYLLREATNRGISTIALFEGPDAGGKGGAIRRITGPLDARNYKVLGVAAPTDEELAQHYLWRFWRQLFLLSRAGRLTIFDRSWYGRVLVERIEGFATEEEWRRSYAEINTFEEQLTDSGIPLFKFWIQISKEEQLARFKLREKTAYKRWKLTDEDWRNRDKWEEYQLAVHDMIQYTSTVRTPWTLIEGNNKQYARIKVLETLAPRLEEIIEKK